MSPVAAPKMEQTVVLHGAKDLRVELRSPRPPQEGEAQVEVLATGLCGSDLHYYKYGRNGDFSLKAPLVLGHESGGIVTAVGPGVTALQVGQRVAIECGVFCKKCRMCNEGRYNLCENMWFCSSAKRLPYLDGTLQGRMNHPVELLHPISDACTYEQAALAEPLSVVLHATRRANLRPGHTVLVLGAGAVGLLACALAKATGAFEVVAVDIDSARLEFAKRQGFVTDTYLLPKGPRPATADEGLKAAKETAEKLTLATGMSGGYDVVFECTGVESCISLGVHAAATGGKLVLVGMGTSNMIFPLSSAMLREVDILGVFRYAHTYPAALALLASGALKGVENMVTHRFSVDNVVEAFELLAKGVDPKSENGLVIKVMIGPEY